MTLTSNAIHSEFHEMRKQKLDVISFYVFREIEGRSWECDEVGIVRVVIDIGASACRTRIYPYPF